MESVKELVTAIVEGKEYSEAFKVVMVEKVKHFLDEKKSEVLGGIFSEEKSYCDCDHPEKDAYGKCEVCKCKIKKEEAELDEEILDVATTYKKIAVKHLKDMSAKGATQQQKDYAKKMNKRAIEASKMSNHTDALNHYRGVKEEAELDERELTDAEMKKREDFVMSMKKNIPDFKKRYGDRWKEVMYATATKMAMKG